MLKGVKKIMVLYADVLVVLNYIISHLMLVCTQRLSGIPLSRRGSVLGSLWGGLCALCVFLPIDGVFWGVAVRIITALGMLVLAYPMRTTRDYLRLSMILFLVSFVFAGIVLGICLVLPYAPISYQSGIIYLHISPLVLLLTTAVSYLFLGVVRKMYGTMHSEKSLYRATIKRRGITVELQLFSDTGNNLKEPFSGKSVAVCSLSSLYPLLTPTEISFCRNITVGTDMTGGMRLVAYNAVGGQGLLCAFEPQQFCILRGDVHIDCPVWVAVNPTDMPGCDGIFSPTVLEMRI